MFKRFVRRRRYGPGVMRIKSRETVNGPFSNAISDEDIDDIEKLRVP